MGLKTVTQRILAPFFGARDPRTRRRIMPFTRAGQAVAFIDGRNLRKSACTAFGDRRFENVNPKALAQKVCDAHGWRLQRVHFYIGVPREGRTVAGETREEWQNRARRWHAEGIKVFLRDLAFNNKEKGIDVRLALDAVQLMNRQPYDVALIFSQDQDFRELVTDLKAAAARRGRPLLTCSVFPVSAQGSKIRGIDNADLQIPLPQSYFEACLEGDGPRSRWARWRAGWTQITWPAIRNSTISSTATAYLLAACLTFGYVNWRAFGDVVDSGEVPDLMVSQVVNHFAQSFFWPYYWAQESRGSTTQ